MQVDAFLLADHAQLSEGKLYINGGGWSLLTVESLPSQRRVGLVIGLRISPQESGGEHTFQIMLHPPGGEPFSQGHGAFRSDPFEGESQPFFVAINTDLRAEAEGPYQLALIVDGEEANRIDFRVALRP